MGSKQYVFSFFVHGAPPPWPSSLTHVLAAAHMGFNFSDVGGEEEGIGVCVAFNNLRHIATRWF